MPTPAVQGRAGRVGGPPGALGSGETVLVVDDEPAVLQAAARILRRNGYTTMEASTGEQALSLLSTHDVQLLLTDSVMPGMTGQVLAGRAAELQARIACSAHVRLHPARPRRQPADVHLEALHR